MKLQRITSHTHTHTHTHTRCCMLLWTCLWHAGHMSRCRHESSTAGCFITFSPEALRRLPQLTGRTVGLLSREEAALDEPVLVVQSAAGVCVCVWWSPASPPPPVLCVRAAGWRVTMLLQQQQLRLLLTVCSLQTRVLRGGGGVSSVITVLQEEGWCPHRPGSCGRWGGCLLIDQGPAGGGGVVSS